MKILLVVDFSKNFKEQNQNWNLFIVENQIKKKIKIIPYQIESLFHLNYFMIKINFLNNFNKRL